MRHVILETLVGFLCNNAKEETWSSAIDHLQVTCCKNLSNLKGKKRTDLEVWLALISGKSNTDIVPEPRRSSLMQILKVDGLAGLVIPRTDASTSNRNQNRLESSSSSLLKV